MSPVAQADLADDVFDLDIELLVETDAVPPVYACSGGDSTCGYSWSGTCSHTACNGCTPTYGAKAPGMCI
ncbi:hypothetical protein [Nonomuraea basaltis]|uniref:hypothetical protein n=1 Tax=Nonomuraea basaltis TaxID=2495887 RepID=UPI00110C6E82|nr:hypothetical protein [Nonomuraea basaltis]TMR96551.1 hypothetical protein EJK15_22550 [Nonomuraea basaltis]